MFFPILDSTMAECDESDPSDLESWIARLDLKITLKIQEARTNAGKKLWKGITFFGGRYFWIILLVISVFCLEVAVTILITCSFLGFLVVIYPLKKFTSRRRPYERFCAVENLKSTRDSSFPSGHSYLATVASLSISIYYMNPWMIIIAIALSLLVSISRVYLGVHYFSDVIVGFSIGLIVSFVLLEIIQILIDLLF